MEMKTGRWSESEVEKLNVMQECGFNIETMSMLLDRPKASVYGKIWHMRKQKEYTSFNIEDLPPKYDPEAEKVRMSDLIDANKPDPSEMIINVPVHELDDPIIEYTSADIVEELVLLRKQLDSIQVQTISTNKTTLGALLAVSVVLAVELLWPILS